MQFDSKTELRGAADGSMALVSMTESLRTGADEPPSDTGRVEWAWIVAPPDEWECAGTSALDGNAPWIHTAER